MTERVLMAAGYYRTRARVEHAIGRHMKNRDRRQRGDGLRHADQAVAHMHNLTLVFMTRDRPVPAHAFSAFSQAENGR